MTTDVQRLSSFESGVEARAQPGQGQGCERFRLRNRGRTIVRELIDVNGKPVRTTMPLKSRFTGKDLASEFDQAWLRSPRWPRSPSAKSSPVTIVDLFSGCGGMTLGVVEACRALGRQAKPILAVDTDTAALAVYCRNFSDARTFASPLEQLLDGEIEQPPTSNERQFLEGLGSVDVLLGGPPCQGHSNLNNHTRRKDDKNWLMSRMVRFAELAEPKHVLIENVPQARFDSRDIVGNTVRQLKKLHYNVHCDKDIDLSRLGVPQTRRRLVVVASRESVNLTQPLMQRLQLMHGDRRNLAWAIEDLVDPVATDIFNTSSTPSEKNRQRVRYLFKNNLYDLPDTERPDCHRLKRHNYKAVYGRLHWEDVAPTITTGFGCMGQGRYVHPLRERTITPHEAARLQFFPDFFYFTDLKTRKSLLRLIGNAVPSKLTYSLAVSLLTASS